MTWTPDAERRARELIASGWHPGDYPDLLERALGELGRLRLECKHLDNAFSVQELRAVAAEARVAELEAELERIDAALGKEPT